MIKAKDWVNFTLKIYVIINKVQMQSFPTTLQSFEVYTVFSIMQIEVKMKST